MSVSWAITSAMQEQNVPTLLDPIIVSVLLDILEMEIYVKVHF
jgi:hypothetical protein